MHNDRSTSPAVKQQTVELSADMHSDIQSNKQSKCGALFNKHVTTNFEQNVSVKKFKSQSTFGKNMDRSWKLTFWPTLFILSTIS